MSGYICFVHEKMAELETAWREGRGTDYERIVMGSHILRERTGLGVGPGDLRGNERMR